MIKEQFTTKNFRIWLSQFSSRQRVGRSYTVTDRPLARFMTEQTGEEAKVMPVRSKIGDEKIRNPGWATEFIHRIDKSEPEYILQTRAIDTLNQIVLE